MDQNTAIVAIAGGGVTLVAAFGVPAISRWWNSRDTRRVDSVTLKIATRTALEERVDKLWNEQEGLVAETVKWRDLWYKSQDELLELKRRHVAQLEAQQTQYTKLEQDHAALKTAYTAIQEAYAVLMEQDAKKTRQIDEMQLEIEHLHGLIQKNTDSMSSMEARETREAQKRGSQNG